MERRIRVLTETGGPLELRLHLLFRDAEGQRLHQEARWDGHDGFVYADSDEVDHIGAVAIPCEPGFWSVWKPHFRNVDTIWCPRIDATGHSWWHAILGERVHHLARGAGMKIGVVDSGFSPDLSLEHVCIVDVGGDEVEEDPDFWIHGEVVCRILGDVTAPEACAPVSPAAELFFASATYSKMTLEDQLFNSALVGDPDQGCLDPTLVTNAIYELALIHEVDLINLSSGAVELPEASERGLTEAILTAAEAGAVVVAAAGNEPVEVADYPARLAECIGVGAIGHVGWGPSGTVARDYNAPDLNRTGTWRGQWVYHWPDSAYGEGVDTVAPGVGILVARDGRPAYDLTGTSFAAPIVTGALAVALAEDEVYRALPRDSARSAYVRDRLRSLCRPTGLAAKFEGVGILELG